MRLAAAGFDLVLASRDSPVARRALERVREAAVPGARIAAAAADLSRPGDVRALAEAVRLHLGAPTLLLHCAAVVPSRERLTPGGPETQWAVNHLAPFLLTRLLPPVREGDGAPGRVVTVSSKLHRGGRLIPSPTLFSDGPYDRARRYADTKLANVLFTRALARRRPVEECVALSLHPGAAATGLLHDLRGDGQLGRWRDRAVRSVKGVEPWGLADCVDRVVDVCLRPLAVGDHGSYREDGRIVDPSDQALDDDLGEWLWEASRAATGG